MTQHHRSAQVILCMQLHCRTPSTHTEGAHFASAEPPPQLLPPWLQRPPVTRSSLLAAGTPQGVLLLAAGPQAGRGGPPTGTLAASSCKRTEHGQGKGAGDPGDSSIIRVPHTQQWSQAFSCLTSVFLIKT